MSTNPLRVAVVGGGIGGVAAAVALLQRGIDVRLYEQAPALTEVGAGVAIQPNGVRMLRAARPRRRASRASAPAGSTRSSAAPTAPSPPRCGRRSSASKIEFYGMHRADLLGHVRRPAARRASSTPATDASASSRAPTEATITFANGARATADVVVAADGIHSTLQQFVVAPSRAAVFGLGRPSRRRLGGERRLAAGRDAQLARRQGKHFLVFPVRANDARQLRRLRDDRRSRRASPGRQPAIPPRWRASSPAGTRWWRRSSREAKNTFRWGLYDREPLAELDQRAPDPAGRRRPPDAAARRPGRQSGHRGRRGAGDRPEPRRPRLGPARAAIYETAAARADGRRATALALNGARYDAGQGDRERDRAARRPAPGARLDLELRRRGRSPQPLPPRSDTENGKAGRNRRTGSPGTRPCMT